MSGRAGGRESDGKHFNNWLFISLLKQFYYCRSFMHDSTLWKHFIFDELLLVPAKATMIAERTTFCANNSRKRST